MFRLLLWFVSLLWVCFLDGHLCLQLINDYIVCGFYYFFCARLSALFFVLFLCLGIVFLFCWDCCFGGLLSFVTLLLLLFSVYFLVMFVFLKCDVFNFLTFWHWKMQVNSWSLLFRELVRKRSQIGPLCNNLWRFVFLLYFCFRWNINKTSVCYNFITWHLMILDKRSNSRATINAKSWSNIRSLADGQKVDLELTFNGGPRVNLHLFEHAFPTPSWPFHSNPPPEKLMICCFVTSARRKVQRVRRIVFTATNSPTNLGCVAQEHAILWCWCLISRVAYCHCVKGNNSRKLFVSNAAVLLCVTSRALQGESDSNKKGRVQGPCGRLSGDYSLRILLRISERMLWRQPLREARTFRGIGRTKSSNIFGFARKSRFMIEGQFKIWALPNRSQFLKDAIP